MKNVYLLLILVSSVYKDEDAEEASVPEGDLEYESSSSSASETVIIMNYETFSINTGQSEYDASHSIMNRYYTLSKSNNELLSSNKALKKSISSLEAQLASGVQELNMYRQIAAKKLKQLADEMDEQVKINQELTQTLELDSEGQKQSQELTSFLQVSESNLTEPGKVIYNSTNDDDDDDEKEESFEFIFVIGLLFMFLVMESIKYYSDKVLYSAFFKALVSLIVVLGLFCVVAAVMTIFVAKDVFDDSDLYFDMVYRGFFVFVLSWLGIGLWIVFACQSFAIIWERAEDRLCKNQVDESNKEFGIMRKLFISNPYLPVFTERVLRPDFNFSEYLKQSVAETLIQVFSLSPLTFILIIFQMFIWRLILTSSNTTQTYFILTFSILLLILSVTCLLKCKKICSALIPSEGQNLGIEYDYNSQINIPLPNYLKSRIPGPGSDLVLFSIYSLKLTCSYLFLGVYPNRHQLLFWMDSFGVKLMISLIQLCILNLSLWSTLMFLYFPSLYSSSYFQIVFLSISSLCAAVTIFFILPLWIKFLTISSSVEMMKKTETISKVVQMTQSQRMKRNWRLLNQFQSLYRDLLMDTSNEKLPKLDKDLKYLIREAFELSSSNWKIFYIDVKYLLHRLGVEMDNDQFRVFLKDCDLDEDDFVGFKNLIKGVKRLRSNLNKRPKTVISQVLKNYFEKDLLSVAEVSEFLQKNRWFMKAEDIHEFLVDLHFNLNSKGLVVVDEIEFSYN